jgi:hypothetical protein
MIGSGDEVAGSFDRNLKLLDLAEIAHEAACRFASSSNHDIHQRGRGRINSTEVGAPVFGRMALSGFP